MNLKVNMLTLLFLSLCTQAIGQEDSTSFEQFVGDWHGEGRFYNVNLASEVGMVRFTLRVTRDFEITGSIGNAEIIDAEIEVDDWNKGYSVRGNIEGQIFPNNEFHKKRITLLLKEVEDDVSIGDFHLANNFIFDFSMRPGELTIRKDP